MAMNVGEANAVNTLLHHVLNMPRPLLGVPSEEKAREAAELLADGANKRLMAGLTGTDVHNAWPDSQVITFTEDDDAHEPLITVLCTACGMLMTAAERDTHTCRSQAGETP